MLPGGAVPDRRHDKNIRHVLDHDLCTQLVEAQAFDERARKRPRAVKKEIVAIGRVGIRDDEIHDDLALGREQRCKTWLSGRYLAHVGGHQPAQELAGIGAGDLDHAAVGEKRCFHEWYLPDVAGKRKARQPPPQGSAWRSSERLALKGAPACLSWGGEHTRWW